MSQTGGLLSTVLSIPQAIGGAAADAISFLTPGSNRRTANPNKNKKDVVGDPEVNYQVASFKERSCNIFLQGLDSTEGFSKVTFMNPGNTAAVGALSAAAVGSLLWSMYVKDNKQRRNDIQQSPGKRD